MCLCCVWERGEPHLKAKWRCNLFHSSLYFSSFEPSSPITHLFTQISSHLTSNKRSQSWIDFLMCFSAVNHFEMNLASPSFSWGCFRDKSNNFLLSRDRIRTKRNMYVNPDSFSILSALLSLASFVAPSLPPDIFFLTFSLTSPSPFPCILPVERVSLWSSLNNSWNM